ncbi:MAG: hypothetical protein JJ975_02215 [Bacteroidia bacterium]|nr:hypothetical protein [Bacteroidia bacterium]
MKRCLQIVFFLFVSLQGFATNPQNLDSIKQALKTKPRVVFGLNNRFSTISGEISRTTRLFAGLDYDKKIRFELALNAMPSAAVTIDYPRDGDTILRTNQLAYIGFQAEYTFFHSKKWKLSFPVQIGLGRNTHTRRENRHLLLTRRSPVVPIEPGVNGLYYIYDWIGLKAGVGLRMSLGQSFSALSGPYYNIGVAVFAGELYRRFKKAQQKTPTESAEVFIR